LIGINVGCGATPTPGYFNYDNSYAVRFASVPMLLQTLAWAGLASKQQLNFAAVSRDKNIRWAPARRLPQLDKTADVVYSSHMVEHLDHREALEFLQEAIRVLKPGGIVRLALPDLRIRISSYLEDGDADHFVDSLLLAGEHPKSFMGRLRRILVGERHHAWMYDASSAMRLLEVAGFQNPVSLGPGETTIENPGSLDLRERQADSLYVEGRAPTSQGAANVSAKLTPGSSVHLL
jgi:SAM-dependent methyltransferase